MIKKLTSNHSRRGIELKHFENLFLALVDIFEEKLGATIMNEQAVDAWKKAFLVLLDIIANALKKSDE